jgi:hypothetical protein
MICIIKNDTIRIITTLIIGLLGFISFFGMIIYISYLPISYLPILALCYTVLTFIILFFKYNCIYDKNTCGQIKDKNNAIKDLLLIIFIGITMVFNYISKNSENKISKYVFIVSFVCMIGAIILKFNKIKLLNSTQFKKECEGKENKITG